MKVNGLTIWPMAKASTSTLVELHTKASGTWTDSKARERRLGLTNQTSLVTSSRDKSTDKEFSNLQMEQYTKANTRRTTFRERASIPGMMAAPTLANGSIIKCMDMAYSRGKTGVSMKANTWQTKR